MRKYLTSQERQIREKAKRYWNYRFKNGLTRRQILFCEKYLENGHNPAKAMYAVYAETWGYKEIKKAMPRAWNYLRGNGRTAKMIQEYIQKRVDDVSEEMQIGFNEKRRKLWHIADTCAPDELTPFEDKNGNLVQKVPDARTAVSAIAEMNKMDGDIAAEKRINVNVTQTSAFKELKEYEKKLLAKKKREY
jgi:hypothetical protein